VSPPFHRSVRPPCWYYFSSSLLPFGAYGWFLSSWSFTDGRTLWTGVQLVARPLTKHRTPQTQNKHTHIKHLCPEWDSNSRSRPPSERRQCMPYSPRLPWPACWYYWEYVYKIKTYETGVRSHGVMPVLNFVQICPAFLELKWYDHMGRQTERYADRQADWQTNRQTWLTHMRVTTESCNARLRFQEERINNWKCLVVYLTTLPVSRFFWMFTLPTEDKIDEA
jgi:hypothetical protein